MADLYFSTGYVEHSQIYWEVETSQTYLNIYVSLQGIILYESEMFINHKLCSSYKLGTKILEAELLGLRRDMTNLITGADSLTS